ncbi:MAG: hypothetical protein M3R49_00955 [Chloroflexota bacterium]|nr:hypothetical protein [Chloroflexota bacterium]
MAVTGAAAVPVAIALGSRLISLTLIAVAGRSGGWPMHSGEEGVLLAWDAQWFLSIAQHGYHAAPLAVHAGGAFHDFAFFPLWPVLIGVISLGGLLPAGVVQVVAANVLFVGACFAVHNALATRFTGTIAVSATLLFALAPPAYVGSLGYSEPLYICLAALYFLPAFRRGERPWPRAAIAIAAQLTRLPGSALSLATGFVALVRRRVTPGVMVVALSGPAAFAAWWLFVAVLTGNPLGYLEGSPNWYQGSGAATGVGALVQAVAIPSLYSVVSVAFLAAMIVGAVAAWRVDSELGVYAVLSIAGTALFASWESMPRHAWVAFPAFAGLAGIGGRRVTLLLAALFVVGQAILVIGTLKWASFPP